MAQPINHVFWLFGLSGAGKSTLSTVLLKKLRDEHIPGLELDGDNLRLGLCQGLGFSDLDRSENLRRAAEVAKLGADSGICVIASFITPLESHRDLVRKIVGAERISMIFVDAPLAVCRQRDVKGLYARAQAGQVQQMTGIGSAFEIPRSMDLILPTDGISPSDSSRQLIEFALARLESAKSS